MNTLTSTETPKEQARQKYARHNSTSQDHATRGNADPRLENDWWEATPFPKKKELAALALDLSDKDDHPSPEELELMADNLLYTSESNAIVEQNARTAHEEQNNDAPYEPDEDHELGYATEAHDEWDRRTKTGARKFNEDAERRYQGTGGDDGNDRHDDFPDGFHITTRP